MHVYELPLVLQPVVADAWKETKTRGHLTAFKLMEGGLHTDVLCAQSYQKESTLNLLMNNKGASVSQNAVEEPNIRK